MRGNQAIVLPYPCEALSPGATQFLVAVGLHCTDGMQH